MCASIAQDVNAITVVAVIEALQIFLMAMTPVGELRLALPLAMTTYGMSLLPAMAISLAGNIFVVLLLLLLLEPVSNIARRYIPLLDTLLQKWFRSTRRKHRERVQKWGKYALVGFVAIPLPITGGWTASLVAFLFDIPFRFAFPLITLGVVIAGGIVAGATTAGIALERYLGIEALGVLIALGGAVWLAYRYLSLRIGS